MIDDNVIDYIRLFRIHLVRLSVKFGLSDYIIPCPS